MKLAVIKTGGKQYVISEGQELKIEKLPKEKDSKIIFDEVLLLSKDGKEAQVGNPFIKDAKVEAKVLDQLRDKKIRVIHYKNKTRQHTVYGHRQPHTKIKITKIS